MDKDCIRALMTVTKAARGRGAGERPAEIDSVRLAEARRQLEAMTALELVDALIEMRRGVGGMPEFFL